MSGEAQQQSSIYGTEKERLLQSLSHWTMAKEWKQGCLHQLSLKPWLILVVFLSKLGTLPIMNDESIMNGEAQQQSCV